MNNSRRNAVVVALAMVGTAGAAEWARPRIHVSDRLGKPDLEAIFPKSFGDWKPDTNVPIILPAPDVQAKLDAIYNQVLTRTYVNAGGRRIMLSVAYGGDQGDGTRAHRPEVCYPAQGFQITFNERSSAPAADRMLPVRRLMSHLGLRHEPITYWMVVGSEIVTSGADQKLVELKMGLRGLIADGMLVRVSSIDRDMQAGHLIQQAFIDQLARAMPERDRQRIFGHAPATAGSVG